MMTPHPPGVYIEGAVPKGETGGTVHEAEI